MDNIVSLFAESVGHHAPRVAIEDWTQTPPSKRQYTYAELDHAASKLAHTLHTNGVRRGDRVPLLAARSPAMVTAVLAILKLGACYVPVDLSSWGPDRIETTLRIVGASVVVCTEKVRLDLPGYSVVFFGTQDMDCEVEDATYPVVQGSTPARDDLAYIIFTSGSTGKPKGVMVAHSSMANYARSNGNETSFDVKVTPHSRILMLFSIAFDGCAGVMFSTLCHGGCLVLANPAAFPEAAKTCTELPLTPSILMALDPADGYDRVESILLGGEKPTEALVRAWATPARRIYNAYGPTEATCVTLMAEIKPGEPIVLGRAVNNASVLLLDSAGNEADEGEICIAGAGLAVGYFEDPARTEEAFVMRHGQRIYKTGDLGAMTPAGITFLGRTDSLVKNRGFLINLQTEVEPAVLSAPRVAAAAALMEAGRLCAFVTPSAAAHGLREHLLQTVSSFLVPDTVVPLDQLPVTGNGKVNYTALRALVEHGPEGNDGPTTAALDPESAVMKAFAVVLRADESRLSSATSFRSLGGHSLAAVQVATALRKYGYAVTIPQVLSLDTIGALAGVVGHADDAEETHASPAQDYDDGMWQAVRSHFRSTVGIVDVAPMTEMQLRLIHGTIQDPRVNFIRVSATFDDGGQPGFAARLRKLWASVLHQHTIFRTSFLISRGEGIQVVHDQINMGWEETLVAEADWNRVCQEHDAWVGWSPATLKLPHIGSLSNVQMLAVPGRQVRIVWTVHHSLVDGWSMANLMNDIALAAADEPIMVRPSFSRVSKTIQSLARSLECDSKKYWGDRLGTLDPIPRLTLPPSQHPLSTKQSDMSLRLGVGHADLDKLSRVANVTPAAIFYTAWALVLSRYCGSEDVVVGSVLAGRHLPIAGVADVCGPLLSTLPLRVHVDETKDAFSLLQNVFASLCDMAQYQWSTNALIQGATGTKATDFFETLLALQYDFPDVDWRCQDVPAPRDIRSTETSEIPLSLLIESTSGAMEARLVYRHARFESCTVQRMMHHFNNVLIALVRGSWNRMVNEVASSMMDEHETRALTHGFENLAQPYPGLPTLHSAFAQAAEHFQDLPALIHGNSATTYGQLAAQSDAVAQKLRGMRSKSTFISLIADGSPEWVVAILAILKAGFAYCPIDYKLPPRRQRLMVELAESDVLIYPNAEDIPREGLVEGVTTFAVSTALQNSHQERPRPVDMAPTVTSQDLACLIFTSGSTGIPKGVQLQHIGILSVLEHPVARNHAGPGQKQAQLVALGFDICVKEVFGSLLYGAALVLKDENDPLAHLHCVDATCITPSMLSTMNPHDYPNLKIITVTGEASSQSLIDEWGTHATLINAYGPAEGTIASHFAYLEAGKAVNAGRPLCRMASYVLDKYNRPLPIGCTGEIAISGVQVTPGYLKMPEKTREAFSPDPFHSGLTMYRTGDIGRLTEDRSFEVVGRTDNQVKVRGSRVDLLDVEAMIGKAYPSLKLVAVVFSNNTLTAFATPLDLDIQALRSAIGSELPYYCQPSQIVSLSQLPLNANQKVDRKALAALQIETSPEQTPLETPTEELVAHVWQESLSFDDASRVGALDNFFDLGGHSLLQIKVAQRLADGLGRPVSVKTVIKNLTLRDLATALDREAELASSQQASLLGMENVEVSPAMALSYLESELYAAHVASGESPALNMPFAARLDGTLDVDLFNHAFVNVLRRDPVLHSRYSMRDGTPLRIMETSVRGPDLASGDFAVPESLNEEINRSFRLDLEQPVRAKLWRLGPSSVVLCVTMHHIVADATTLNVFMSSVSQEYGRLLNGEPGSDPAQRRPRYETWAEWVRHRHPDPSSLDFWEHTLHDAPRGTLSSLTGTSQTFQGLCASISVPPGLHTAMRRLSSRASVTKHHIVLAAVALTLRAFCGIDDIVLGAPYANRLEPGSERMAGLLLDRVPIRISTVHVHTDGAVGTVLAEAKAASQAAIAHWVPFPHIVTAAGGREPLFETMVSYHTHFETAQRVHRFGECKMELIHVHAEGAKYPLMFEFTETAESLVLDMEYDTGMFGTDAADALQVGILRCLELITQDAPLGDIMSALEARSGQFPWSVAPEDPVTPSSSEDTLAGAEEAVGGLDGMKLVDALAVDSTAAVEALAA